MSARVLLEPWCWIVGHRWDETEEAWRSGIHRFCLRCYRMEPGKEPIDR